MKNKNLVICLCLVVILVSTFFLSYFQLVNHDVWFHLKTGDVVLRNFTSNSNFFIPRNEIFSHTMKGDPWVAHEWLFGLIFFLLYYAVGIKGIIIVKSLIVVFTFICLFRLIYMKTKEPSLSLLYTIVALILSRFRFFTRPDIFSFLLLVITLNAVFNMNRGKKVYIMFLPLLTVFWVNIHGAMAIMCPGILIIYLVSKIYDGFFHNQPSLINIIQLLRKQKQLLSIIFFCIICLFINPAFTHFVKEGKDILLSHSVKDVVKVPEWTPPDSDFSGFWIYLILGCSILFFTFKRLNSYDFLLFILSAIGAISARRNIPIFALMTVPVIANHTQILLLWMAKRKKETIKYNGINPWFRVAIVLLSFFILSASFLNNPSFYKFGTGIKDNTFPENAIEFVKKKKITGKMYNTHWFGGYLTFFLYPEWEIFVDGRNTIFAPIWSEFKKDPWNVVMDKYKVDFAIVDFKHDSLYKLFKGSKGWHLIYFDDLSAIFLKDGYKFDSFKSSYFEYIRPETISQKNLSKFLNDENLLEEVKRHADQSKNSYNAQLFAGNLYLAFDRYADSEKFLKRALLIDPRSLDALINLGFLMTITGRIDEGLTKFKEALMINPKIQGEIYASMADKYTLKGEIGKGIEMMEKAVEEQPQNPEFHKKLRELNDKKRILGKSQ